MLGLVHRNWALLLSVGLTATDDICFNAQRTEEKRTLEY